MAKKQRKNCYAIHFLDNGEDVIVKTWADCQKRTKGRGNMFKGFMSEDEAREWLASITGKKEQAHKEQVKRSKEIKRAKGTKATYLVQLEPEADKAFRKRVMEIGMPAEKLIENLILEYLYD